MDEENRIKMLCWIERIIELTSYSSLMQAYKYPLCDYDELKDLTDRIRQELNKCKTGNNAS